METKIKQNKDLLVAAFVLVMLSACSLKAGSGGVVQPTGTTGITPTSEGPPGSSQMNPVQFGSEVNADNMTFVLSGSVRPADGIVSSGDMFNPQPEKYHQYIFVTLSVTCETTPDQHCHLSPFDLKLIGSDGIFKYPERLLSGVDGILEDINFQGGETISANVPFIISVGDSRLILVYDSHSGDSYYLALP